MNVWHLTTDTPRTPLRVSAGEPVTLTIGTWPVAPDQEVWVVVRVARADGTSTESRVAAVWQRNDNGNGYWRADCGPFNDADVVRYSVHGRGGGGPVDSSTFEIRIGPKLFLALLWHQHQPLYRDLSFPTGRGSYTQPWVRLHAIRDYYAMAQLVAEHPGIRLTINLTPVLLRQIEDYATNGASDVALELTLTPSARLTTEERETIVSTFFDADWHNQIFPHDRYKELFVRRHDGLSFDDQDLRDLRMWFNLAWFAKEFRDRDAVLVTGEIVRVKRFVDRARGFSEADLEAIVVEQLKVLAAIVPLHRALQERGQIEVSTTPMFHPILPLLVDTDRATLDRPGTEFPVRFARPEDAAAQVRLAVEQYRRAFGVEPRGMWPAEGAVSQFVLPCFAEAGIRWIASDGGVLARSGRWGYDVKNPDVLCQPYRAEESESALSIFFRDAQLADKIGFQYQHYPDPEAAAKAFLVEIRTRFVRRLTGVEDRVLTVVLDGENAWGAYRDDARPFLHALYSLLERDTEIRTVTFSDYLAGDAARGVATHPTAGQLRVHDLFTGSWIDEMGSGAGIDLGTWIGEPEENRAWELLVRTRDDLERSGARPASAHGAFDAMYAAEGSDWFWWFGDDQDSGNDSEFDELYRALLRQVYRSLGLAAPSALDAHIVPRAVVWEFSHPVSAVQAGDRLTVRTHCPGTLTWRVDDGPVQTALLAPSGGAMAGTNRHSLTLGPLPRVAGELLFEFQCSDPRCDGRDVCCRLGEQRVTIVP